MGIAMAGASHHLQVVPVYSWQLLAIIDALLDTRHQTYVTRDVYYTGRTCLGLPVTPAAAVLLYCSSASSEY